MSNVIISRRGGSSSSSGGSTLKTKYITFTQNWIVPGGAKNNEFSIRIFGAGGSVAGGGGGSGWMNNEVYNNLTVGQYIPITIGSGNINGGSTGSSSFGTYLSANSGAGAWGGSGGIEMWSGGTGFQFGGGGGGNGGDGGVWGGGGGGGVWGGGREANRGGNGGTYGGGGGGANAGNGGTYGGGGGCTYGRTNQWTPLNSIKKGIGGIYGGNGTFCSNALNMSNITPAQNGINTSTWTNVFNDGNGYFRGWGIVFNNHSGGGGFGGNGGKSMYNVAGECGYYGGGGGGGYGSN